MRPPFHWRAGTRTIELGRRTLVMGILNVTPDSFSDGGAFLDPQRAVERGLEMLEQGAAILDVGGESTRPRAGASTPAAEELRRVLPVITEIRSRRPDVFLSIDTYKAEVARESVAAGADIVNDVSGLTWDGTMAPTLAQLRCGVVLMHSRGRPAEWKSLPPMSHPAQQVRRELEAIAERAQQAGIARERIVLDPGFGFGKNYEENLALLREFARFADIGFPLLAGASRKNFIGRAIAGLEQPAAGVAQPPSAVTTDVAQPPPAVPPNARVSGSVAAAVLCAIKGAHLVRVHDVRETVEALAVVDACRD